MNSLANLKASFAVPAWSVQIVVGLVIAISAFLITNGIGQLQAHDSAIEQRMATLEARNATQDNELAALHIQLDTINTRGTSGADSRLSSLDARLAALDARVSISADRLNRLEQSR